ncbi:hypothetical protein LZ198_05375 [Myxococcus sp. K15C18031901]|uniref:hypothetical protein n=1 Tax=Myxococcus dinghuensis TaxID=2906761 RepID=UPI0020A701B6|nr:hypothetical protein [Myxococcus dinghuensis]MCP3098308.1 hypothetical protein [Myxococcus dinghuensis]
MNTAKTLLNFVLVGTLLGAVVASLVGPHAIGWYNETPLATQTMCNLPQVVRNVTSQLLTWQVIGAGIGAAAFLALGVVFTLRMKKKAQARPPAPPSGATQTPA